MDNDTSSLLLLHRIAIILDCFSPDRPELGVREVARLTDLSSSTAGRLMMSMKQEGLLRQNHETRTYGLGSRILTWAGMYSATLDVRTIALPHLRDLHQTTQETISLYLLEGSERVCVERLESPQNVRIVARIGLRLPLHAGSAGKVLLAYLPEEQCEHILASEDLRQLTEKTITDPEKLRQELAEIRAAGYAVSQGEWLLDASGIAAPIFDQNGCILAALTISGPGQRFTPTTIPEYIRLVVDTAQQISRSLGYRPQAQLQPIQPILAR